MDSEMQRESQVMTCLVQACSWNCKEQCCAPSITVGDDHPLCDTFTTAPAQPLNEMAPVANCHVHDCHFNEDMKCRAAGITVGFHTSHADCMTFRP